MAFSLPIYRKPDFDALELKNAPDARWAYAPKDGVAPEGFHSTSMYPEYFKLEGVWRLATESRMDASVVWREDKRQDHGPVLRETLQYIADFTLLIYWEEAG